MLKTLGWRMLNYIHIKNEKKIPFVKINSNFCITLLKTKYFWMNQIFLNNNKKNLIIQFYYVASRIRIYPYSMIWIKILNGKMIRIQLDPNHMPVNPFMTKLRTFFGPGLWIFWKVGSATKLHCCDR